MIVKDGGTPWKFLSDWNKEKHMDFSQALKDVKGGVSIARTGWNGKGQYVVYQKGYPDGIAINKNTSEALKQPEGTVCKFRPYLMLCTADGSFCPWVPSISDILADDWVS